MHVTIQHTHINMHTHTLTARARPTPAKENAKGSTPQKKDITETTMAQVRVADVLG
jgi:hypothetical protein